MKTLKNRPDIHSYFMSSERATCLRRRTGAVFVRNDHPLTAGYNGPPRDEPHCNSHGPQGCYTNYQDVPSGSQLGPTICKAVHAEENAILMAAKLGIPLQGSVLYSTNEPCTLCTNKLINLQIKKIYFVDLYEDDNARQLRKRRGIECIRLDWDAVIPINYENHWRRENLKGN